MPHVQTCSLSYRIFSNGCMSEERRQKEMLDLTVKMSKTPLGILYQAGNQLETKFLDH